MEGYACVRHTFVEREQIYTLRSVCVCVWFFHVLFVGPMFQRLSQAIMVAAAELCGVRLRVNISLLCV